MQFSNPVPPMYSYIDGKGKGLEIPMCSHLDLISY